MDEDFGTVSSESQLLRNQAFIDHMNIISEIIDNKIDKAELIAKHE